MIYVLDTNVIIHYLKNDENVKKNFRKAITDGCKLLIPRAVDYEVCRGLELLSATKLTSIYRGITAPDGKCDIVDMGEDVWRLAKKIYVGLYRKSLTVGEIDILIGAFCLHRGYPLVTSNTKDFINMSELKLINWWIT